MTKREVSHPDVGQLAAFSRGLLGNEPARKVISAHLKTCRGCCRIMDEIPDDSLENLVRAASTETTFTDDAPIHNRQFLAYWKPEKVDRRLRLGDYFDQNHSASNQFRKVTKGDTVWVVTIRDGRLHFITRIIVEQITNQYNTARLLRCKRHHLREAEFHIIGAPGRGMPIWNADIHGLAEKIRFVSAAGPDMLTIGKDGAVMAQQFRILRELTPQSADLLKDAANETETAAMRDGEVVLMVPNKSASNESDPPDRKTNGEKPHAEPSKRSPEQRKGFTYGDFKKADADGRIMAREWPTYEGTYEVAEFEGGKTAVFYSPYDWKHQLWRVAEFKSAHRNKTDAMRAARKLQKRDELKQEREQSERNAKIQKAQAGEMP